MSPLLYQLSYTARKDGTQSLQDTGMIWRVSSPARNNGETSKEVLS
jgi:hypothetical protein